VSSADALFEPEKFLFMKKFPLPAFLQRLALHHVGAQDVHRTPRMGHGGRRLASLALFGAGMAAGLAAQPAMAAAAITTNGSVNLSGNTSQYLGFNSNSASEIQLGVSGAGTGAATVSGNATLRIAGNPVSLGYAVKYTMSTSGTSTIRMNSPGQFIIGNLAEGSGLLILGAADGATPVDAGTFGFYTDVTDAATLTTGTITFGAGTGTIVFNHNNVSGGYQFTPAISGGATASSPPAVDFESGITVMTGAGSDYYGVTTIGDNGSALGITPTLVAGAANVLSVHSDYAVQSDATLQINSQNQSVGSLNDQGLVDLAGTGATAGAVLTVAGDYTGGGVLNLGAELDTGVADQMVIQGGVSGATTVNIDNLDAASAATAGNGILLITTAANAPAGSFVLGAIANNQNGIGYQLAQGAGADAIHWYLRAAGPTPPPAAGPTATAVPALSATALALLALLLAGGAALTLRRARAR
jgi:hypothetical protein